MKILLTFLTIVIFNSDVIAEIINLKCNVKVSEYSLLSNQKRIYNDTVKISVTLKTNSSLPFTIGNFKVSECKLEEPNQVICSKERKRPLPQINMFVRLNRNTGKFMWDTNTTSFAANGDANYHLHSKETGYCEKYIPKKAF
tara:strand:- start:169 stop:594 length:426 start_codon:yes stop_codon:yes gene_type:complete